jgi:hypothetical protein
MFMNDLNPIYVIGVSRVGAYPGCGSIQMRIRVSSSYNALYRFEQRSKAYLCNNFPNLLEISAFAESAPCQEILYKPNTNIVTPVYSHSIEN